MSNLNLFLPKYSKLVTPSFVTRVKRGRKSGKGGREAFGYALDKPLSTPKEIQLKSGKVAKTTNKPAEKPPTAKKTKAVNFDFDAGKVIVPRKSSRIEKK